MEPPEGSLYRPPSMKPFMEQLRTRRAQPRCCYFGLKYRSAGQV
jgi:hypothetical protein